MKKMITITPNPAMDLVYRIDALRPGEGHRVQEVLRAAGGKGLNVAKVIHEMGGEVTCTGFPGEHGAGDLADWLKERGIASDFVSVPGNTRQALSVIDDETHSATEFREPGSTVSDEARKELFERLQKAKDAELFACSGSLPPGLSPDFYDELLAALPDARVIIDTSGEGLRHVVYESPKKPYAIKPNRDELIDLFGPEAANQEPIALLKHPALAEIPVVVLSLGKDGCVARIDGHYYKATVPTVQAVNAVGSGDSSIAGLMLGLAQDASPEELLKLSMACGAANAMEEAIGHVDPENVKKIRSQVTVEEVL